MRRDRDAVKTKRWLEEGEMQNELIDWVSLAKRHISTPVEISVKRISSETQVMILVPSCVTATGPDVYRGPIARVFLKAVLSFGLPRWIAIANT